MKRLLLCLSLAVSLLVFCSSVFSVKANGEVSAGEGEMKLPAASSMSKEPIWSGLWNGEDMIPESTELIFHSQSNEDGDKSLDSQGSFVLLLAGVFLLLSTVIVAFILREKEKKAEKPKKSS